MVVAIILNAVISYGKGCLKHYHHAAIALVIAATMAGIFLFNSREMETDGKETGNMFHVKHV
jgi:hypothetical protein